MRLFVLALCCATLFACSKTEIVDLIPTENNDLVYNSIVGDWHHSFEEDVNDVKVFRTNYNFPVARARNGFTFNDDGSMAMYYVLSNDLIKKRRGSWSTTKGILRISLSDKDETKIYLSTAKISEGILTDLVSL